MKSKVLLLIFLNLFFGFTLSSAQEKLRISAIEGTPLTKLCKQILPEAYQRIGIQISVEEYPASRALHYSNSGKVDGELMRIAGIEKKHPNLIRIPVSYVSFQGVVFSKKELDFPVKGWSSLKPYKIGILRGVKYSETGTKGMRIQIVDRHTQLVKLLDYGRIDIIVMTRLNGLNAFRQANVRNFKILEPPLVRMPLFHYLHIKNQHLVPKITDSLREMRKEGRFQTIYEKFEEALSSAVES